MLKKYVFFVVCLDFKNSIVNIPLKLKMTEINAQGDINFNYYHEYCRLHLANVVLMSQMRELVNERN